MWRKDRTELEKQRERLLRLQVRVQSELYGVNSALKAVPVPEKRPSLEWTEALEGSTEGLKLHFQPSNDAKLRMTMLSKGLSPYYCCAGKYTGKRLVYGLKSA